MCDNAISFPLIDLCFIADKSFFFKEDKSLFLKELFSPSFMNVFFAGGGTDTADALNQARVCFFCHVPPIFWKNEKKNDLFFRVY